MLTRLIVRNFKLFEQVEIELGNPVVFVGPNNSGKTTAFQALSLWDCGLRRWQESRGGRTTPEKRPGVTINREDLVSVPVPNAKLLWRDTHVRDVSKENGKPRTKNIRIDVIVEGVTSDKTWSCGLEFDYANDESLYCRPLRLSDDDDLERMPVPLEANSVRVCLLPPMSGLADREFLKQRGEVEFLIGQGRTAEVARNLAWMLKQTGAEGQWREVCRRIKDLFGVELLDPQYSTQRSQITMGYRDRSDTLLDLSSGGRGFHQTLLLLLYIAVNPASVLLLDEPDAHLEILRQRQIYQVLSEVAAEQRCQIIAASHSEIILNEAADRDMVVAFVGKPHRIDDRGSQVMKSLKEIGFDQYYLAEERGWVLYLEGPTDLAILRSFAKTLEHRASRYLESPFVHYVMNQPNRAREHFHGLSEAKPDLVGITICDRLDKALQPTPELAERMWSRREIENYLCQPQTLRAYAAGTAAEVSAGPLFESSEIARRAALMDSCIQYLVPPVALADLADPYWSNVKASDELLDRLFKKFYDELKLPNLMTKTDYHVLAGMVPRDLIDREVSAFLDSISEIAERAKPAANG